MSQLSTNKQRYTLIPTPFDGKRTNCYVSGSDVIIETIPEYLARVTIDIRDTFLVTVMLPKDGHSAGTFPIATFSTVLADFDFKLYGFVGGLADENFIEITFSSVESFLDLTDTPDSYTGQSKKFVRVKEDLSGLEFFPLETTSITIDVHQPSHSLSVGYPIRVSGTNTYVGAQANNEANAEVVGYVTEIVDGDNFKYVPIGEVTTGVPSQPAGTVLFLSPTVQGGLTATEPTTVGQVSKPLMVVIESGAKALFINYRGMKITPEGEGGGGITNYSEIIKFDSGVTEGTDLYTFNGSASKTIDIKAGANVSISKAAGEITINAVGGSGGGDVTGPSSAIDNNIAVYDSTTGKIIKDGGTKISDLATVSSLSGYVPTSTTVNGKALSSNITLSPSDIGSPSGSGTCSGTNTGDNAVNSLYSGLASSKQDTLVSTVNIKSINGVSILGSGDLTIIGAGGDVTGPSSSVDDDIVLFNGVSGKIIKDSGKKVGDFATSAQGTLADNAVPNTRTINSKQLNANITLTPSDIGSPSGSGTCSGTNSGDNAATTRISGTLNEIAYFDTTESIKSLAVATYPSLTELSYIKGVTSSIQTQINGKGVGDMLLGTAQSITETKTFTKDKLLIKGTSTGTTNLTTANTSATSYTATLPAKDGTVAMTSDIVSQVEDSIVDGHTTVAPSGNAVFDALASKAPLISPSFTTPSLGVAIATSINGATITSGTLNGSVTGTNTGDQTSIVGITGTMAQFDTAVTDGNFVYQGQALGTPASGTLTNCTFPTLNQNTSGTAANITGIAVGANGGTGVANTGKTITIGGNLTFSGAYATTFTVLNTTSVTLPTSGTLMANLVEDTTPELGGNLVVNQKNIDVSATLSTNSSYSGIIEIGTVGENVVFGDVLYLKFSDGKWWKAKADAYATTPALRMAMASISANSSGVLLIEGNVRYDSWSLAARNVWLSAATAGAITTTQPSTTGNQIQFIGTAKTSTTMYFKPSNDVGER